MTISSSTSKNQYTSTGTTGYDYTFKILKDADLQVILTDGDSVDTELTLSSDYTVSGAGDAGGGRISLAAAPTVGHTVTIIRDVDATQEMDLVDNDDFPADVVEDAFDKLTMLVQMLIEEVARAAKVPASSTISALELPAPAAGEHIAWNEDGTALVNSTSMPTGVGVSTFMRTVLDDESAGSACATMGAFEASKVSAFAETVLDDESAEKARNTLAASNATDYISVLLAPDADTDHDINITGGCRDSLNAIDMIFDDLCKRADAVWAAGDDEGGMASGVSLNSGSAYHVLAVAKADGSSADVCFDTSESAFNFRSAESEYTKYRAIGHFKTDGSANIDDKSLFSTSDNYFTGAFLHIQDTRSSGTEGGDFNNSAWRTRALDTVLADQIPGASLASNQITLPAGRYFIKGSAPAYQVNAHKAQLYDTTNAVNLLWGTSERAEVGTAVVTRSIISGLIRLSGTTVVELQHQCGTSKATDGLGKATSLGTEVYAELKIRKVK